MPDFNRKAQLYKPTRDNQISWDTFRRGLNTLLQDNEIRKDELAQADNMLLIGQGIPTKRWGSQLYFQAGNATGSVRALKGFYKSNSTIELLAITDDGFLTAKDDTSFRTLTGVSWASGPSGISVGMAQLDDDMYIVHPNREMVRYSNPTLTGFPTIAIPVFISATNLSNATGTTIKSYRISAVSQVGETLSSTPIELASQPSNLGDPAGGTIRLTWTGVSTASGILQGFNIYGRSSGNERFLAGVPGTTTTYDDDGSSIPLEFTFPPLSDTTGGVIAKDIVRFQDRLILTGIDGSPSEVLISGRTPFHERFDLSFGGNYVKVEPDAGDDIVKLFAFSDRIIVFKEKSIWQITLSFEQVGNFFVTQPDLKLITASYGCIAPNSVVAVDNDIFFLSREGVRSLGYQANYTVDQLRTQEVSIKVRPFFNNLTVMQKQNAVATYFDNKYIIAFPGKDELMIFDRERAAWMGPWSLDSTVFEVFYDQDNNDHLLFAREGTVNVDEFSSSLTDDKGTAISTTLKTRNEDFGDWSAFKNIRNLFMQMRNVTGNVNVDIRLETRTGLVNTAKNFNITPATGNSGWGADQWADAQWGDTEGELGGSEANFLIRWANLNKLARLMSLTFRTNTKNANYELLGIKSDAKLLGKGATPSSWRV